MTAKRLQNKPQQAVEIVKGLAIEIKMEFETPSDGLPPVQDLKALIREEHWRAELQRLRMGLEGCGCAECQEFYGTLNLAVYGDRVKHYASLIAIEAGKAGADLMDTGRDYWDDTVFFTSGRGYAVASDGATVDVGREVDILQAFTTGEIAKDLCPDNAKVLKQILEYREELNGGDTKHRAGKASLERSRFTRPIGAKSATARPSKARPRLPLRISHPKK